jgi:CHASE3 domain sensor protein
MLNAENGIVLGSILQRSATVTQSKQLLRDQASRMEKALAEFRPLSDSAMLGSVDTLQAMLSAVERAHDDMMGYLDKQQFDAVQKTFDETVAPRLRDIRSQAESLIKQENDRLNASAEAARGHYARVYWTIGIAMILVFCAAGALLIIINQTNGGLRNVAGEISKGAEQVAMAAAHVCGASQSLAQCSSEQAAALEETSASMEEMSSVTHKNTDNSRSTVGLMEESDKVVGAAERTVRELSVSMQEISASGEKITKVVKMIDDIAFQTKILSLNAAVEAARAGAAGAGFAVVAEQVGHLAQECAEAARSTAEMIDDTVARVRDGGSKLGRAAEAIQEVVKHSARMRVLADEVNVGSQEQSKGIDEVSRAVAQMQQMTQKTAANAEETASAGQQLDSHAETLNRIVAKMHALVGGVDQEDVEPTPTRNNIRSGSALASSLRRNPSPSWGHREAEIPALQFANASADRFPMEGEFKEF